MPGGIVYRGPKQDREPSGLTAQEILEAIKAAKSRFGVVRIGGSFVAAMRPAFGNENEVTAIGPGRATAAEAQADADRERLKWAR